MGKKSYIIRSYKVSRTTYRFIEAKLSGLSAQERRFFLHLLCSHLLQLAPGEEALVPGYDTLGLSLPSKTIKAEFGSPFPSKSLKERKLIIGSDYIMGSKFRKGTCSYYLIEPTLFQEIVAQMEQQVVCPDGSPAVNLFDGTAYDVAHAMPYPAEPHRPSSKLMRDAARVLHAVDCPINPQAIHAHLAALKAANDPAYDNDRLCAQTIFAGMKHSDGVASYIPSYAPQDPGRIGENGGGLQSCTKLMKQAAFKGIDHFNYDLRSSHGYVLLQELKLAGLDRSWVEEHLGPGVFEERARRVGLSKKDYKKCFFSTINGASHVWKSGKEEPGPIQQLLLDHFGEVERAKAKFAEVVKELEPLKKVVGEWHRWLLSPECPHRRKTQREEYILNAAGQWLDLSDEELEQKVNAHILQGQEAAFIHHLTILSKHYAFVPVSNQHDGLITLGNVPEEAKVEAGKRSGFEQPFLEIKPFV